jgi:hypothetical protein
MTKIFTTEELKTLSAQVDQQLRELEIMPVAEAKSVTRQPQPPLDELPPQQHQAIEEQVQENPKTFLQKFAHQAKALICNADSDLRTQYQLFGDLNKEETLEKFAGFLAVMGFSGTALKILTVAITVYVIRIGIQAFSKKYCQED